MRTSKLTGQQKQQQVSTLSSFELEVKDIESGLNFILSHFQEEEEGLTLFPRKISTYKRYY